MKVKPSLEQAICVLMLLAIQKREIPLHSTLISQRLGLSDSYTKKVIQHLSRAGLVRSVSGKDGGFVINREPDQITMLDVFNTIEGTDPFGVSSGLADHVFGMSKDPSFDACYHMGRLDEGHNPGDAKEEALAIFAEAEKSYRDKLAASTLNELCPHRDGKLITIDWTPWLQAKSDAAVLGEVDQ